MLRPMLLLVDLFIIIMSPDRQEQSVSGALWGSELGQQLRAGKLGHLLGNGGLASNSANKIYSHFLRTKFCDLLSDISFDTSLSQTTRIFL